MVHVDKQASMYVYTVYWWKLSTYVHLQCGCTHMLLRVISHNCVVLFDALVGMLVVLLLTSLDLVHVSLMANTLPPTPSTFQFSALLLYLSIPSPPPTLTFSALFPLPYLTFPFPTQLLLLFYSSVGGCLFISLKVKSLALEKACHLTSEISYIGHMHMMLQFDWLHFLGYTCLLESLFSNLHKSTILSQIRIL